TPSSSRRPRAKGQTEGLILGGCTGPPEYQGTPPEDQEDQQDDGAPQSPEANPVLLMIEGIEIIADHAVLPVLSTVLVLRVLGPIIANPPPPGQGGPARGSN